MDAHAQIEMNTVFLTFGIQNRSAVDSSDHAFAFKLIEISANGFIRHAAQLSKLCDCDPLLFRDDSFDEIFSFLTGHCIHFPFVYCMPPVGGR